MKDILERLFSRATHTFIIQGNPNLYYDAAHEIERLRAENEKLREDLKATSMNYHSGYDDGVRAERERCVMQCEAVGNRINTTQYERSEWDDGYVCGAMDAAAALKETE